MIYARPEARWKPEMEGVKITESSAHDFQPGDILLTDIRGQVVHPCPGTLPPYICCGYYVIDMVEGCPLDCAYCILHGYLGKPYTLVNTDLEEIFCQIMNVLGEREGKVTRFGTGELSDSLSYPFIAPLNTRLMEQFDALEGAILEFKTKHVHVDWIKPLSGKPHVVFSWSLNAETPAVLLESKSPHPVERIKAAAKVASRGYPVGFHFDPLVYYPRWRREYRAIVEEIFRRIPPEKVAWISLGTLRYPARMSILYRQKCRGFIREQVKCADGKMRYIRPLREEMYSYVYGVIRKCAGSDVFVYLCMESFTVWEEVFGASPISSDAIDEMFSISFSQRFWMSGR